MSATRMMGPNRDLPSPVVHGLVGFLSGKKDIKGLSHEQRQAIFDAMATTKADGQSNRKWRARAVGILIQRGWGVRQ